MGIIRDKSMEFAVRIVNLCKYLRKERHEYEICNQLLRSGTAVGALQREAEHAESMADFIHKFAIAQKECNETLFWLELLYKTDYLTSEQYNSLNDDARLLMALITRSIKTAKQSQLTSPYHSTTPTTLSLEKNSHENK